MTPERNRRARGDRGAAAVEFALVLPLLLLIIFGVIDFGRAYNAQETLTQAARVGARLSVVGTANLDVQTAVQKAASPAVSLQLSDITVTALCGTSGTTPCTSGITSCTNGAKSMMVTAIYALNLLTPLPDPPVTNPIKLKGTATAPC